MDFQRVVALCADWPHFVRDTLDMNTLKSLKSEILKNVPEKSSALQRNSCGPTGPSHPFWSLPKQLAWMTNECWVGTLLPAYFERTRHQHPMMVSPNCFPVHCLILEGWSAEYASWQHRFQAFCRRRKGLDCVIPTLITEIEIGETTTHGRRKKELSKNFLGTPSVLCDKMAENYTLLVSIAFPPTLCKMRKRERTVKLLQQKFGKIQFGPNLNCFL